MYDINYNKLIIVCIFESKIIDDFYGYNKFHQYVSSAEMSIPRPAYAL